MTTDFERFGYSKARPSRTTVSPAKDEALDLARRVRAMVRAENSRVFEARRRGVDVMDVGSRDEADGIQADLYEAWPAKRLDALIAALSSPEPVGEGE